MIISVRRFQLRERFPAVMRYPQRIHFGRVNGVGIFRIRVNRHVIERALPQFHFFVNPFPSGAGIIRAEHAAVFCLNDGINNLGFAGRDGQANASQNPTR